MAKKVNYTADMVEQMTTMYGAATTDAERKTAVSEIAEALGRSVPSVRTKLSQLKVYIKPGAAEKTENTGETMTKTEMVETLEPRLGLEPGAGKSLKFATKPVLEAIMAVTEPVEVVAETEGETGEQEESES